MPLDDNSLLLNPKTNSTSTGLDGKGKVLVGRVVNIFLEKTNDDNLGAIEVQPVYPEDQTTIVAYPFFPNSTSYPLLEEIVLLNKLPSEFLGVSEASEKYYYMGVVNIWNNPHVNFYPSPRTTDGNIPKTENKSYQEISAGSTINIDENLSSNFPATQGTFEERDNIHPLQPYLGDTIYQGRFGNSIRFGSTNKTLKGKGINDWSDWKGEDSQIFGKKVPNKTGDPIIILRNGQPILKSKLPRNPWTPIDEQINWDLSSIYMTSNQQIPISVNSFSTNSFKGSSPPAEPNTFAGGPQVIIRADRLVFNARQDSILLSAERSVHLSSNESLNFDTKNFIIDVGQNIKLGSSEASQSLILGDKFLFDLNKVMSELSFLCKMLQSEQIWPVGVPVPAANVIAAATTCEGLITTFQQRIESYKSKTSFTD